jgi:hypothetical protein
MGILIDIFQGLSEKFFDTVLNGTLCSQISIEPKAVFCRRKSAIKFFDTTHKCPVYTNDTLIGMTPRTLFLRLMHPFNTANRTYASGEDPWKMARAQEQYRFQETNRIIREQFGDLESIIEFGSGEGHQTEWLSQIAPVHGVEVSAIAVQRARARCPQATFEMGSVLDHLPAHRFDLATGFECLWYVPQERYTQELERLSACATHVIISYYQKMRSKFDPLVAQIAGARTETISYENVSWTFAWWSTKL